MHPELIPSILETSYKKVVHRLEQVHGAVRAVQIDICDGVFVPSNTWPYMAPMLADGPDHYDMDFKALIASNGEDNMPMWEDFDFELDLMIADAKKLIPDLLAIGPVRVLFHAEAMKDLEGEMHELRKIVPGIVEVGIAINAGTNPEILFPLIDGGIVTSVQCMGIAKIGYQGQPFDERVFANLKTLRARYPDLPLCVDGAVTLENAQKLIEAGATRLAPGSGVFTAPDIKKRIADFKEILEK